MQVNPINTIVKVKNYYYDKNIYFEAKIEDITNVFGKHDINGPCYLFKSKRGFDVIIHRNKCEIITHGRRLLIKRFLNNVKNEF